jgi:uncharacterized protein with PQ loop repeat
MHSAEVVGLLTVVFALLVKILGLPDQIIANHRRKSTEGVSLLSHLTGFMAYLLWTIHGFMTGDLVIILGQFLGVVTTGVILWQFILYRRRPVRSITKSRQTNSEEEV